MISNPGMILANLVPFCYQFPETKLHLVKLTPDRLSQDCGAFAVDFKIPHQSSSENGISLKKYNFQCTRTSSEIIEHCELFISISITCFSTFLKQIESFLPFRDENLSMIIFLDVVPRFSQMCLRFLDFFPSKVPD